MKFHEVFLNKEEQQKAQIYDKIIENAYGESGLKDKWVQKETFSPSNLFYDKGKGVCPRYWVIAFTGGQWIENHNEVSLDNMQAGTDAHERIQGHLKEYDPDIIVEYDLRNEDPPVHGFVDLICNTDNGKAVGEIKTTRSEAFSHLKLAGKGREYQEMQLLLYMYLLKIDEGFLLYENKNDHEKLIFPVSMTDSNKQKVEKVIQWMQTVYKAYEDNELPKINFRSNSRICAGCPYKNYCKQELPEGTIKIESLNYQPSND